MTNRQRCFAARVLCAGTLMLTLVQPNAWAGGRRPEPSEVVPLNQIPAQHRENVADVIRNHTLHRRGTPDTFPANPRVYLSLLNEPTLTLALWKNLGESPARLQQVGPNRFYGTDGSGTTASWEFLVRSQHMHVLLCDLDYVSPRGAAKLSGRIVLIVRSGFYREVSGEPWVQHDIEAFVKVDSRAWKALAATLRPLVESVLEDQVHEAGLFVSLMSRLVETYPDWATNVAAQTQLNPETRTAFTSLVQQTRRPNAFSGRPVVADARPNDANTRRR